MTASLAERVLDAFPTGQYGLTALLRIVELQETTEVETAAVECVLNPRLRVNPNFVAVHADTPEKLLMLIMHELHHILLGHTVLFKSPTPLDNLVLDAVINATLCRMFPDPASTSFLTDFYAAEKFPDCLLRPPDGWTLDFYGATPPGLEGPERGAAQEAHRALYSPRGAYYEEVYQALERCGLDGGGLLASRMPALLGSHKEATRGDYDAAIPVLLPHARDWHDQYSRAGGRSWSDVIKDAESRVIRRTQNRKALVRLIRMVARLDGNSPVKSRTQAPVAGYSVVPSHCRRTVVLQALNVPQVLYEFHVTGSTRAQKERVHVYVDVSGSIGAMMPHLYGAVLDCGSMVHPVVHLFSTEVADASLDKIKKGFCRTTWGTDIKCVAHHIAAQNISRAVILTDGFVGLVPAEHRERMKKCVLGVALLKWGSISSLRSYANFVERLDPPSGNEAEETETSAFPVYPSR